MERGCNEELQICSMDESCQPGSLHEISIQVCREHMVGIEVRRWRRYH